MERKHDEKKTASQKPQLDEPQNQQKKEKSILINLQYKAGNQAVQRLVAQQKTEEGFGLDDKTTAKIQQARSSGQSLDRLLQRQMETKFGKSLDDVQLHTDQAANTLSQQLGASAFTIGSDVFFREGKYDPDTTKGQKLLAHELTHVLQQREGKVNSSKPGLNVRPAGDKFEQEANSTAQSLISSASPQAGVSPGIQRQEDWEAEIEDTSNYSGIGQTLSAPIAAPSQPSQQAEAAQDAAIQAPSSSQSQQETAQIEDRPAEIKPQQTQQVEAEQGAIAQTPPSSQSQQETAQIEDRPEETKPQQVSPTTQTAEPESLQDEAQSNANPSIKPVQNKVRVSAATHSQQIETGNPDGVRIPSESRSQQETAQIEAQSKDTHIGQSQAASSVSSTQQIEAGYPDVVRVPSASQSQAETAQVEDHSEAPKEKTIKEDLKNRLKESNKVETTGSAKRLPIEEEEAIQAQHLEEEEEELQMQEEEEEEEEEESIQPQMEEEEEELQMQSEEEEEEWEELQMQQEPEEEEEEIVPEDEKKPEEEEVPYESYPTQAAQQTDEQLRREIELHRRSHY